MRKHVHAFRLCVSLLLTLLLVLPGCAAARGVPAANAAAQVAAPAASTKAAMLKYLKESVEDLDIIDKLIDDKDLGLTEDIDESSEDEMSADDIAQYMELLAGYSEDVKKAIDGIGTRETPDNADIAAFKAAELAEFQLMSDLLDEYLQVLGYYDLMMQVSDDMDKLGGDNTNTNDLNAIYKSYNDALTKAADTLKNGEIPSCLKSMNDNLIAALGETNDAVLYLLNSIALDDPLRQSAAIYRYGILLRKLQTIYDGFDKDLLDRQKKLTADAKSVEKTNDGLKQWLQSNIDKLG